MLVKFHQKPWTKRKAVLTLTVLSSPPDTTQRPSGVNLIAFTPRVWPLYVWIHPFFLISHILRFVSKEPDAKNSPKGWKSTDIQLDLWPVSVRTTTQKITLQWQHNIDKQGSQWGLIRRVFLKTRVIEMLCIGQKKLAYRNKKHTLCLL